MKLNLQQLHGNEYHIEIPDASNFSSSQMKDLLVTEHKLQDGNYTFVFNGRVLNDPNPFAKLAEGAKVIFLIRNAQASSSPAATNASQPKASPPAPSPAAQPQAPTPAAAPKPAAQPVPARPVIQPAHPTPVAPQPAPVQRPQVQPAPAQPKASDLNKDVQNIINTMGIIQAYDPEYDLWTHPSEVTEFGKFVSENADAARPALQNILLNRYEIGLQSSQTSADTLYALMGVILPPEGRIMSDYDAELQQMSNQQREGFQRVLALKYDKEVAMQTYLACGCDPDQTIACLGDMSL